MVTTGDDWIIPYFQMLLHFEHISCVITNCGQYKWAVPHFFQYFRPCGWKALYKCIILIFRLCLPKLTVPSVFPHFIFMAIFPPYFLQVGLLLQHWALIQLGSFDWIQSLTNAFGCDTVHHKCKIFNAYIWKTIQNISNLFNAICNIFWSMASSTVPRNSTNFDWDHVGPNVTESMV